MNPQEDTHTTICFMEDKFELGAKQINRKAIYSAAVRKHYIITAIRVAIALAAALIALWLYILVDEFISYHQFQRFHRVTNTAFLLIK